MATDTPSKAVLERNGSVGGEVDNQKTRVKLHGRAFYESIGSPKIVLAPMVEQSEFVRLPHPSFLCMYED
jgi:tRNA-dihydrouridine synthase 1